MSADSRLAPNPIEREDWPDGSIVLHNHAALPDPLPDILDRFDQWVANNSAATFITERVDGAIVTDSYGDIDRRSDAIATDLTEQGITPGARIAVLDGPGRRHAALKIACLKAGLVHVPLSPLLLGSDHGRTRLAGLLAAAAPRLLFARDAAVPDELGAFDVEPIHALDATVDRNFSRPAHTPDDDIAGRVVRMVRPLDDADRAALHDAANRHRVRIGPSCIHAPPHIRVERQVEGAAEELARAGFRNRALFEVEIGRDRGALRATR